MLKNLLRKNEKKTFKIRRGNVDLARAKSKNQLFDLFLKPSKKRLDRPFPKIQNQLKRP